MISAKTQYRRGSIKGKLLLAAYHASQPLAWAIGKAASALKNNWHVRNLRYSIKQHMHDPSALYFVNGKERYLIPIADRALGRFLYVQGEHGYIRFKSALEILSREGRRHPADVLIDVGANLGSTTIPALTRGGVSRVIAIEPDPRVVPLLRVNAIINGVDDRVDVRQVAIGEKAGTITLEIDKEHFSDSRVHTDAGAGYYNEENRTTTEVECTTLEQIGSNLPHKIVFMEIQGHEIPALRGLKDSCPVVMLFWPYGIERTGAKIGDLIDAAKRYTHFIDIRSPALKRPIIELDALWSEIGMRDYTDIVLL